MPITNGRYVNPGWVNLQAPAINAPELNAMSNMLENLTAPGGRRGGYVVVGTSTEGATAFDCDFLCDGTADDVEINAAIQMAQAFGLDVLLLNGTFNISNTINLSVNMSGLGGNKTSLNRTNISFQYLINASFSCSVSDLSISCEDLLSSSSTVEIFSNGAFEGRRIYISDPPNIGIQTSGDESSSGGTVSSIVLDEVKVGGSAFTTSIKIIKCDSIGSNLSTIKNCVFGGISEFVYCGSTIGGFFVSNCSFNDVNLSNCVKCVFSGNSFAGNLNMSSGCQSNMINSNIFTIGAGISLESGTTYNVVTGNGGGSLTSPWSGVTDNGSNNYVANNMPTS